MLDDYMQLLKTAASGERAHAILPGRTSKSKRSSQGTVATDIVTKTTKTVAEPEEKPVITPQVVTTTTPAGAPKVDINFSVKVGSAQTDPKPRNTRARVDSTFMPSGSSYESEPLLEEGSLMRTPALPGGSNSSLETVGDIKTATATEELKRLLAKAAIIKPSEPAPPPETFEEEQGLQRLLQDVKQEGLLASSPVKVGAFNFLRKLSNMPMESAEGPEEEGTAAPAGPTPEMQEKQELDSQRKQDLHEQQLQFNEDKHELEMEKLRQELQQEQETHQLKQQLEQEKLLEKRQGGTAEQGAMPQMDPAMQQAQQQMQYQQNIMAKAATIYTDDLEPLDISSAVPALAVGGGLGGAAAHFIAPTAETKHYRSLAAQITKEQEQAYRDAVKRYGKNTIPGHVRKTLMEPIADVSPARKRYFLNRALQSNAKRLVQGTGLGLLAGLASYYGMKE